MEAFASVPMVAMVTVYKMAAMEALTMLLSGTSELPINVAILELMATILATYLHKNGCHDHISPYKAVKKIRALLAVK